MRPFSFSRDCHLQSLQNLAEPGVFLRIVNEAVRRLCIGLHVAVEGGEPADDKFLLERYRLVDDAAGIIGDRCFTVIGSKMSDEAIDVAFGDDRRFGGILFRGFDMPNGIERCADRVFEPEPA